MIKYVTDPIILPDNHTYQDLEDAKLSAKWRRVVTREDVIARTDLSGKCGSCKAFRQYEHGCMGNCAKHNWYSPRPRSTKACTLYEPKEV